MTWLDGHRMGFVLVGFACIVMLGGDNAKADFTFGEPTNLGPTVNGGAYEEKPCISADGLSLYFSSDRPGGYDEAMEDIWGMHAPDDGRSLGSCREPRADGEHGARRIPLNYY